jgi:hypothetical protein
MDGLLPIAANGTPVSARGTSSRTSWSEVSAGTGVKPNKSVHCAPILWRCNRRCCVYGSIPR